MLIRICLAFLVFISASVNAEIYRWVDDQGRTHFGDRPSPQATAKRLSEDSEPVGTSRSVEQRQEGIRKFLDQRQRERDSAQAAKARAEEKQAKLASHCRELRARLIHMDRISTFYDLDEKGEQVFVSEAENRKLRERFRAKVEATCGR
ncbi:DUF4124 domain-containing protein [Marinobacter halotolerans]|uniref:DUF4124 domain-containing protein n=1 Tax=Marinobacter halotolerans TaxID=1569211 RepID=UPI00124910D6|nr:DUF4124 domain-containing protein [Marinobacter halotolerans]